jgi:hypothetical protein
VVDAGGFAPLYNQQGEIKFEMLLESFRQMHYDAISIGTREMLMQRDTYNAVKKLKVAQVPLATLNIAFQGKRFFLMGSRMTRHSTQAEPITR